jgi:16S rRNA processing protein RimM
MSDPTPSSKATAWTVLAHLLRPQGRKGEILAELLTDFPARFSERDQLYLAPAGFTGSAAEARPIQVVGHWLPVGRNQGRIVLHLAGIDSIEQAEVLAHLEVIVPDEARVELAQDEEYIDDLLDCHVYDGPTLVGSVTAVDFPTTPDGSRRLADAAPLLTVTTPDGGEVLIPYVQSFLVSVSVADRRIDMQLPAGLLELNA